MEQTDLFKNPRRNWHGGTRSKGKRKTARPLARGKWVHVTLKAPRARGKWSLLSPSNKFEVERIVRRQARKWGVTVSDFVNMGNHLHIKSRFQYRQGFQNFLRSATALIARKVTKARRGRKVGRFWQGLAHTRILTSSLEILGLRGYFEANRLEATKGSKAREAYLRKLNAWIYRLRARAIAAPSDPPLP